MDREQYIKEIKKWLEETTERQARLVWIFTRAMMKK